MNTNQLRHRTIAGLVACCTVFLLFTGCGTPNNTSPNETNTNAGTATGTTAGSTSGTTSGSATNSPSSPQSDQQATNTNQQSQTDTDRSGLPEGVTIKRVIKEVTTDNGYQKVVELLSDGGERITLTAPDGSRSVRFIEYEGVITAVNDRTLTIQVKRGTEKTITVPEQTVIDDEDAVGFHTGVEIDWTVNNEGQIESIELDRD